MGGCTGAGATGTVTGGAVDFTATRVLVGTGTLTGATGAKVGSGVGAAVGVGSGVTVACTS